MYTALCIAIAVLLSIGYSLLFPFGVSLVLSILTGGVAGWYGSELDFNR